MVSVFIGMDFIHLTKSNDVYYLQYGGGLGTSDLSVDCCVYLPAQKCSAIVLQCDTVVQRHSILKHGHCLSIACYTRSLAYVIVNSKMCMWEVS